MKAGFLGLKTPNTNSTTNNNPDLIQLVIWDELPLNDDNQHPVNIRYIARFNDILAAQMHFHAGLRKHSHDIDQHSYKTNLSNAIAIIESNDDLRHKRIWIDPAISEHVLKEIQQLSNKKRSNKKIINWIIQLIGVAALGLLAFRFLANIW